MKFYSKTNSFLYSINNANKEKSSYEEYVNLPLNNFCLIYKSPIIIKYKNILRNVKNNYCFFSKEMTNIENYKNKVNSRNKIEKGKNKKIKESIMFDQFNNKLIKNKYNLNDKNILKKKNEEKYMINENENEENNNINNLVTDDGLNMNEKINRKIKKNNNEYNKDNYDEISYIKNNEINKNNFDSIKDENDDNVNIEIKGNNFPNSDSTLTQKYDNMKKEEIFYDGLNKNLEEKSLNNNLDLLNYQNNNKYLYVSPQKKIQKSNHNILKPINILETKKHKIPNSAYPTPNIKKNNLTTNRKREDLTGITTPSTILKKKIFNDSNITNNKIIKEKKNRNRSLINIINHNENEGKLNKNCKHINEDFKSNSKNKYNRHFGNEDSCPICVAIQMKNKFLEERNKMLPLLTKNNIKKNDNNKSPSKDRVTKTIYPNDRNKKLMRIGSGTSILTKRNIKRRNESVKQMRKIEMTNYSSNENKEEMFPAIKQYFN